jgi:hypothetical protein
MNGFETILPFLRPIEHLIVDESVSEVMVNGGDRVAAFAGTRTPPGGTGSGLVSSARITLPRSLAGRCLCHFAR